MPRPKAPGCPAAGRGLEPVDATDRAAALDLLGGGRPEQFASAVRTLLAQRDDALALEMITAGLARHPESRELAELQERALYRLMERHQLQDPFASSSTPGWRESKLAPVAAA